jgi:hypothetical protein
LEMAMFVESLAGVMTFPANKYRYPGPPWQTNAMDLAFTPS